MPGCSSHWWPSWPVWSWPSCPPNAVGVVAARAALTVVRLRGGGRRGPGRRSRRGGFRVGGRGGGRHGRPAARGHLGRARGARVVACPGVGGSLTGVITGVVAAAIAAPRVGLAVGVATLVVLLVPRLRFLIGAGRRRRLRGGRRVRGRPPGRLHVPDNGSWPHSFQRASEWAWAGRGPPRGRRGGRRGAAARASGPTAPAAPVAPEMSHAPRAGDPVEHLPAGQDARSGDPGRTGRRSVGAGPAPRAPRAASVPRAVASQVSATRRARARRCPRRLRRTSSRSTASRAPHQVVGPRPPGSRTVRRRTASSWPPIRVATAGVPQAPASVTVMPQPSRSEDEATTQARR